MVGDKSIPIDRKYSFSSSDRARSAYGMAYHGIFFKYFFTERHNEMCIFSDYFLPFKQLGDQWLLIDPEVVKHPLEVAVVSDHHLGIGALVVDQLESFPQTKLIIQV